MLVFVLCCLVQADCAIGIGRVSIMVHDVLPHMMEPMLVFVAMQMVVALMTAATLSFLGIGVSPTSPSLGTLINHGNSSAIRGSDRSSFPPAGAWVRSLSLLSHRLRDAISPKPQ